MLKKLRSYLSQPLSGRNSGATPPRSRSSQPSRLSLPLGLACVLIALSSACYASSTYETRPGYYGRRYYAAPPAPPPRYPHQHPHYYRAPPAPPPRHYYRAPAAPPARHDHHDHDRRRRDDRHDHDHHHD